MEPSAANGSVRRSSVAIDVSRACIHAWDEKLSARKPRAGPRCVPNGMCRKASRKYLQRQVESTGQNAHGSWGKRAAWMVGRAHGRQGAGGRAQAAGGEM